MEKTYVFGDQSVDYRAIIAEVFAKKEDIVLQRFLEKAYEVVKVENKGQIQHLNGDPNFTTIQELVDRCYNGETRDVAIENAVACISQFNHFIGYELAAPTSDFFWLTL
jgi:hypothetical protein